MNCTFSRFWQVQLWPDNGPLKKTIFVVQSNNTHNLWIRKNSKKDIRLGKFQTLVRLIGPYIVQSISILMHNSRSQFHKKCPLIRAFFSKILVNRDRMPALSNFPDFCCHFYKFTITSPTITKMSEIGSNKLVL